MECAGKERVGANYNPVIKLPAGYKSTGSPNYLSRTTRSLFTCNTEFVKANKWGKEVFTVIVS